MPLDLPSDDDGPSIGMTVQMSMMMPGVEDEESKTPARRVQRFPSLECISANQDVFFVFNGPHSLHPWKMVEDTNIG